MSGVPSVDPPSTLRSTVRSRASSRLKATWAARTTGAHAVRVVEGGQADEDVHLADRHELGEQLVGEDRAHSQRSWNQKKS